MLVVLIVLFVMLIGIAGIVLLTSASKAQRKAENSSERILDETFDGRDHVTYTVNMRSLKYGTVVSGARERGYTLVSQDNNQYGAGELVFARS